MRVLTAEAMVEFAQELRARVKLGHCIRCGAEPLPDQPGCSSHDWPWEHGYDTIATPDWYDEEDVE